MKEKTIYVVTQYQHLVGESEVKGVFLNKKNAHNQFNKLVKLNRNWILKQASYDDENPEQVYQEALNSNYFRTEDDSVWTCGRIEEIRVRGVRKGSEIYVYNYCDEVISDSKLQGILKTKFEMKHQLKKQFLEDEEYFDKCVLLDVKTDEYKDYEPEEFENEKKECLDYMNKNNIVYCSENDEYFAHRFQKVIIQ